jgi:adenomatosis polyposis coli protein
MSKLPTRTLKENPVDMMRAGAPLLPPYLPVSDETNRFLVEDSPCNFSVVSALSGLTIESNVRAGPSRMIK